MLAQEFSKAGPARITIDDGEGYDMKTRGIIKGKTIELDTPAGLPDGQRVEVEIRTSAEPARPPGASERADRPRYPAREELGAGIAAAPDAEVIRAADKIRKGQEKKDGIYQGSIVARMRAARDVAEEIAFTGWSTAEELEARFIAALQATEGM